MDQRLTRLLALPVAVAAIAVPSPASAQGACADAEIMPTAENLDRVARVTRCLINEERRSRARVTIKADRSLAKAAQVYAEQMVARSFFDHVSPTGSTPLSRIRSLTSYLAKTTSFVIGENLAWGSGDYATPRDIVHSWMESPGHRRNILNKSYRHVGIGVAIGAPENTRGMPAATYVTEFGRRSRLR